MVPTQPIAEVPMVVEAVNAGPARHHLSAAAMPGICRLYVLHLSCWIEGIAPLFGSSLDLCGRFDPFQFYRECGMKLFQSYVGEEQKSLVAVEAIPFDASLNSAPETREYELFKNIFADNLHGNDDEWGLVSWKFEHKSLISIETFRAFCEEQFRSGYDCVFINPMIGNEALYFNVWEQGHHMGHKGLD